ncbi:MAG TPA: hypothetical protein VI636_04175 [Candidatus Angelobacter sp.]
MRLLKKLCFFLLASGLALGQASAPDNSGQAGTGSVADELKALRESIAQHQQQITRQQQQINALTKELNGGATAAPRMVDASLTTSNSAAQPNVQPVSSAPVQETERKESPLSFRIGAAEFTPGGFVDFENVFRSTNTGNVAATSFGAIPFSNTVAGHLTEYRSTGQYSRFNIKTHAKFGENDITGYVEFDFNGNDAANVFVTSNSHTDRIRLYWLDLKRGKWEFLGGQTWGLQTPNRVGVSPNPADLSLGYHEDAGIGVGYNYTRAGEFRAAYHVNDHFVWAIAAQNPDQFTNGEVVFPAAFNAQLGSQLDAANITTTPNLAPDVLTKMAYDSEFGGGRHFHWEGGAMETAVKVTTLPTVAGSTFNSHISVGGGIFGDLLVDLFKGSEGRNLRFVGSGMWGAGIGRYLNGLAPNAVVVPVNAAGATCTLVGINPVGCDAAVSKVHAGDMVVGFEFAPHSKSQLGVYYGGLYAQRNAFPDLTKTGFPLIGFGGVNSANNNNRAVQEGTIDWTQTFWKNPQYGAVLLVTQASYVTRAPWFVAAGAPKNAHLGMGYVSLRYVLP